jgi:hypothetical protein
LPLRHLDEIVVVDTGSLDGTQDIVRSMLREQDIFDEIEWPESFGEARNHSLSLATGDYIVILDGDEYFADGLQLRRLKMLAARGWPRSPIAGEKMTACEFQIYSFGPDGKSWFWQPRLFLRDPSIRYTNYIHNQIGGALARHAAEHGYALAQCDIRILHTGYNQRTIEETRSKYGPRLPLLEQAYEDAVASGNDAAKAYTLSSLCQVLFRLGHYREALDRSREIAESLQVPERLLEIRLMRVQTQLCLMAEAARQRGTVDAASIRHDAAMLADLQDVMGMRLAAVVLAELGHQTQVHEYAERALGIAAYAYLAQEDQEMQPSDAAPKTGRQLRYEIDEAPLRETVIEILTLLGRHDDAAALVIANREVTIQLVRGIADEMLRQAAGLVDQQEKTPIEDE